MVSKSCSPLDDAQLREIESDTRSRSPAAPGKILAAHFGRHIEVEFKDDKQRDPVTAADKSDAGVSCRRNHPPLPQSRHPGRRGHQGGRAGIRGTSPRYLVGAGPPRRHHQLPERPARFRLIHRRDTPGPARGGGAVYSRGLPTPAADSCCTAGGAGGAKIAPLVAGVGADDEPVKCAGNRAAHTQPADRTARLLRGRQPVHRRPGRQGGRAAHHRQHCLRAGDDGARRDAVRHLRRAEGCGTWRAARWRCRRPAAR